MKTVTLFLATNLAVLILFGFTLSLFGVTDTMPLLLLALIFGMGGSYVVKLTQLELVCLKSLFLIPLLSMPLRPA